MDDVSLQRLIRHAYSDGTYSYHYGPVEAEEDNDLVNQNAAMSADDRADRVRDWPPQPLTAWLIQDQRRASGTSILCSE